MTFSSGFCVDYFLKKVAGPLSHNYVAVMEKERDSEEIKKRIRSDQAIYMFLAVTILKLPERKKCT